MIRTLNGLSQNVINVNSLSGGNAVSITDSTINVDINKQQTKSTISDTDIFLLEEVDGSLHKITGANLKASAEQSTVISPLLLTGNSISIKGLNGFTANKILKVNSVGDSITYADDLWDETNDILRPFYTSSNVLIGGVNMDGNLFKFQVEGNSYINGNLLIETDTNTDNRQLVVNGTSEFKGLIHSKGTVSTPGYINIYAIDKNYHTSLYPTETVNANVYLPNISTTLVGVNTIDTLTGKTLNSTSNTITTFTGNSSALITTPSAPGTLLTNQDTIPVNKGGTNITAYSSGDLIYASSTTALSKLPIGPQYRFLMSNGSLPVWGLGHSAATPLILTGLDISINGLNGYGSANQIVTTTGSELSYSSSLTSVALSSCTGNISQFTNDSNYLTSVSFTSATNFGTSATGAVSIGKSDQNLNLIGNGIYLDYTVPFQIAIVSEFIASSLISYDASITSMVFGEKGGSGYNSAIHSNTVLNLSLTNSAYGITMSSTAGNITYTAPLHSFSGNLNINLGTNNSYSNIANANCQPLLLLNKATTGTIHSHLVLKRDSAQSDFIIIRQNNNDELLFHHENSGDDFVVGKAFEYGNKGAKWKYTDPRTYLYNSEDTNGASTVAGSVMSYHKDGSTVFFNTTSAYSSGDTNYFSFAKSNDQQARITMDGNAQIAVAWLDSNDPSDRRIKYDIQEYQNASSVIDKIKIRSFMKYQLKNFNNDGEGKMLPFTDRLGDAKYSIGVIAQEIAQIPELAFMVEGSFEDTVNPAYIHNYIPIISLLVKSNQEQQQTINELKATIDKLNSSTSFKEFKTK